MIALSGSASVMAWAISVSLAILILGLVVAVVLGRKLDDPDNVPAAVISVLLGAGLAVIVFFMILGAGGFWEKFKTERGRGDAPRVKPALVDDSRADWVIAFPDGFGNVATKCVADGLRGFVTTKASGSSDLELVPDPGCQVALDKRKGG